MNVVVELIAFAPWRPTIQFNVPEQFAAFRNKSPGPQRFDSLDVKVGALGIALTVTVTCLIVLEQLFPSIHCIVYVYAVSYTHLDVYKRQAKGAVVGQSCQRRGRFIALNLLADLGGTAKLVANGHYIRTR